MGYEDLNEKDIRVLEYMQSYDFEDYPWSTEDAAVSLRLKTDEVYESMVNIIKNMKGEVFVYYRDGALRVITDE